LIFIQEGIARKGRDRYAFADLPYECTQAAHP
jgi:hypothetical protein